MTKSALASFALAAAFPGLAAAAAGREAKEPRRAGVDDPHPAPRRGVDERARRPRLTRGSEPAAALDDQP
jgi:hypothetical protein